MAKKKVAKKEIEEKKIRLSPSSIKYFMDCPKCFWLEKKEGIKRPFNIFPSLPNGMDRIIKEYCDKYRKKGLMPPVLQSSDTKGLKLYSNQNYLGLLMKC